MKHAPHLSIAILLGLLVVWILGITPHTALGQTGAGTVSGGWRMPLMEENRLKTLLTGDGAKPLPSGALEISKIVIKLFDDQTPPKARMTIEAPVCRFDSGQQRATSDGPIALKATDGSFSIQGRGFLWDQGKSTLTISNAVRTVISRNALQSEAEKKGLPVHVNADRFDYDKASNVGHYRGNVRATEGDRFKLESDQLRVELPDGNDTPQSISADGNIRIQVNANERVTNLTGTKAHYKTSGDNASLTLDGSPTWHSGNYRGKGSRIDIADLNTVPIFNVSGEASIAIQLPGSEEPPRDPQTISLQSDAYAINETEAVFTGNVHATSDAQWSLSSQQLTAAIEKKTQSITRILATKDVRIEQHADGKTTTASGQRAEFTPSGDALSDALISGTASVVSDDFTSSADSIHLRKTGTETAVAAEGHITLVLPRQSTGDSGFLGLAPVAAANGEGAAVEGEVKITANRYRLSAGSGRFEGNVTVSDSNGTLSSRYLDIEFGESRRIIESMTASGNVLIVNPDGELSCHELVGKFAGKENRLKQLIASNAVELRNTNGVATGTQAIFLVDQQRIELTGDPELRTRIVHDGFTRNVLTTADLLIWDQADNTFKGRGKYRSRTLAVGE